MIQNRKDQEMKEQESSSKLTSNRPERIWKKPRALLFVGVCAGLISLSLCGKKKGVEFSQTSNCVDQTFLSSSGQRSGGDELIDYLKSPIDPRHKDIDTRRFNHIKNKISPVLKWNIDKKWEWKPFEAGEELKLKESTYLETDSMKEKRNPRANSCNVFAKQIAVTVKSHVLPDPRLSEEALNDYSKFWGHDDDFLQATKEDLEYFASISPQFNKEETQILRNARNFFSDEEKMEKVREIIEGAQSAEDLFTKSTNNTLSGEFFTHLENIQNVYYGLNCSGDNKNKSNCEPWLRARKKFKEKMHAARNK